MTATRNELKWNKKCLLGTDHDQPYRAEVHLFTLKILWIENPDLRDECREDWLVIIEWCREDPFCNDDKYFSEWKTWQDYYAES